eukprot:1133381-Rhodomonas_salina.1
MAWLSHVIGSVSTGHRIACPTPIRYASTEHYTVCYPNTLCQYRTPHSIERALIRYLGTAHRPETPSWIAYGAVQCVVRGQRMVECDVRY